MEDKVSKYFLFFLLCLKLSNSILLEKFCSSAISRSRLAIAGLCVAPAIVFAQTPLVPTLGECITDANPQTTTVICRKLGLVNGRLRGCDANENCFSTSATSATKRSSPWSYSQSTDDAFLVLRASVESQDLRILKSDPKSYYILAGQKNVPKLPSGSSIFYEFLLRPEDKVVLFRGVVDKTVFVYPLQQPVPDFGAINSKLDAIFSKTSFTRE
eukprot:gene14303-30435_t